MRNEEINKKFFKIKRELLNIYKKYRNVDRSNINLLLQIDEEIHLLYNEYLKLYVIYDKQSPEYSSVWQSIHCSCYYYALNLPMPKLFKKIYEELTGYYFESHLGSIATLPYLKDFDKNKVLDYLYSDLEALNIKWYQSDIEYPAFHGGYKIALLVDDTPNDSDFHFVRQNIDGLWSEKDGCGCEVVNITNPEEFTNDIQYKYVTTLELVKPTLKK